MTKFAFSESQSDTLGAHASDGTYPVTLITPGQGTTAYYSESVIASDAPKAFPKGTHVYLNHSTNGPNPEKLLGVLVEDTVIRESDGAAVNRFKPMPHWAEFVKAVGPHCGLSINARGDGMKEVREGREVVVAKSIDYHRSNSVDLVSFAGREGSGFSESAFQEALASVDVDVQPDPSAPGEKKEVIKMEEKELRDSFSAIQTSLASLVTLMESAVVAPKAPTEDEAAADRAAAVAATSLVESAEVPASVKTRLLEGIKAGNYEVKAEIDSVIELRESIKTELQESGFVVGAAGSQPAASEPVVVKGWSN